MPDGANAYGSALGEWSQELVTALHAEMARIHAETNAKAAEDLADMELDGNANVAADKPVGGASGVLSPEEAARERDSAINGGTPQPS